MTSSFNPVRYSPASYPQALLVRSRTSSSLSECDAYSFVSMPFQSSSYKRRKISSRASMPCFPKAQFIPIYHGLEPSNQLEITIKKAETVLGTFLVTAMQVVDARGVTKNVQGSEHRVFVFLNPEEIHIDGMRLQTQNLIIKTVRQDLAQPRRDKIMAAVDRQQQKEQESLYKIPRPLVYTTYKESGLRIEERVTPLTSYDNQVEEFARHWLTINAKEERIVIYDLRVENLGMNHDHEVVLLDPGSADGLDETWENITLSSLISLANTNLGPLGQNNDEKIERFTRLIADFPKEKKEAMVRKLKTVEVDGFFPANSKQVI